MGKGTESLCAALFVSHRCISIVGGMGCERILSSYCSVLLGPRQ